ncbi:hypothetical protein FKM82_031167 [Ascaphus truei]
METSIGAEIHAAEADKDKAFTPTQWPGVDALPAPAFLAQYRKYVMDNKPMPKLSPMLSASHWCRVPVIYPQRLLTRTLLI